VFFSTAAHVLELSLTTEKIVLREIAFAGLSVWSFFFDYLTPVGKEIVHKMTPFIKHKFMR
jgi:hypothetical protein